MSKSAVFYFSAAYQFFAKAFFRFAEHFSFCFRQNGHFCNIIFHYISGFLHFYLSFCFQITPDFCKIIFHFVSRKGPIFAKSFFLITRNKKTALSGTVFAYKELQRYLLY
jgi:hypothetical protein